MTISTLQIYVYRTVIVPAMNVVHPRPRTQKVPSQKAAYPSQDDAEPLSHLNNYSN